MHSGKTQIRFSLFIVSCIALGTSLFSVSYLNQMTDAIDRITYQDARMIQLGESISRQMLEARREEKNFIIYLDTLYLNNTTHILSELRSHIQHYQDSSRNIVSELDTIQGLLNQYEGLVLDLTEIYQEDPNTFNKLQSKLLDYEKSLETLAAKKKVPNEDIVSWMSTLNVTLVSANAKISAEKARHFSELKSISEAVVQKSQQIAEQARISLEQDTKEGLRYSTRAQRNTLTLIFLSGFLLLGLIIWFPKRIFRPYDQFIKALNPVSRGAAYSINPNLMMNNEIGKLSEAIETALRETQTQSMLKTIKIQSIQRMYRRLMEELDDAIIILDKDYHIVTMNNQALTWFHKDTDRMLKKLGDIPSLWEAVQPSLINIDRLGRTEMKFQSKELRLNRKKISLIPILREGSLLEYVILVIK